MRRFWAAIRRRMPPLRRTKPPPPFPDWPRDHPALVPAGAPRRPLPSSVVVLEPPTEPDPLEYPTETDAVGRDPGADDQPE